MTAEKMGWNSTFSMAVGGFEIAAVWAKLVVLGALAAAGTAPGRNARQDPGVRRRRALSRLRHQRHHLRDGTPGAPRGRGHELPRSLSQTNDRGVPARAVVLIGTALAAVGTLGGFVEAASLTFLVTFAGVNALAAVRLP